MSSEFQFLKTYAERHPYPLLFATVSGAHLYGFPSHDSDFDLRGVHILPIEEVVGLQLGPETITKEDELDGREIDLVTHDAKKFFELLLKKNGYVLEQLLSPLVVHSNEIHHELKEIAARCVTRHHARHYLGFFETQLGLLEKESAPRVKPLLYAYRVLLTGIHLMRTGSIEANLRNLNGEARLPWMDELILRKTSGDENAFLSENELEFHKRELVDLRQKLVEASENTSLPDAPLAKRELHDLLVRLRLQTGKPK